MTRLSVCQPCLSVARAEERHRQFQLQEFKLLHSQQEQLETLGDK